MSELGKGKASCHKTLLQHTIALPKVRSALCAASQLHGGGPLMWKMLLHLHVNQNPMMMMIASQYSLAGCFETYLVETPGTCFLVCKVVP